MFMESFLEHTPLNDLIMLKFSADAAVEEAVATGNPVTFTTEKAKPLRSLLIPFTPVQSGTGDPSPQNIRSILPWNGLKVFSGNSNFLTGENRKPNLYAVSSDGTITAVNPSSQGYAWSYDNSIFVVYLPAGKYTIIEDVVTTPTYTGSGFQARDENNGWLAERGYATFTLSQGKKVGIVCKPQNGAFRYSIVKGTAGEYEKQETTETDIVFPSPVYGGTLDVVSGVMTVEWKEIAKTWGDFTNKTSLGDNTRGTLNISAYPSKPSIGAVDAKCNVAPWNTGWSTDSVHFYTNEGSCIVFLPNDTDASTEIQVVYPLATPQEITLTPEQITALVGNNTIWSDADGSMTAVYLKKKS